MSSKRVPEDTVEYWLYFVEDTKITDVIAFALNLSKDYIWHDQAFNLHEIAVPTASFHGVTHFGDNYDDEWFIVYLLFEISRHFPSLVIRVSDFDGDFLLIEAADELPDWLTPENSANRVFISGGEVQLVEPEDAAVDEPLRPADGADSVRRAAGRLAAPAVGDAVRRRLRAFAAGGRGARHGAACRLPLPLARLLRSHADVLPAAVHAFYTRQPTHAKLCRGLPAFGDAALVTERLVFTRHLYAMLRGQRLPADHRCPIQLPVETDSTFPSASIGLKLTCGFEILSSEAAGNADASCRSDSVKYSQFLDSLSKVGYFRGELRGSREHSRLSDAADRLFDEVFGSAETAAARVQRLLRQSAADAFEPESSVPPDDDDDWLTVRADDLDEPFDGAMRLSDGVDAAAANHSAVAAPVNEFLLDGSGPVEGAEAPCRSPRRLSADGVGIDLRVDDFESALHSLLGMADDSDAEAADGDCLDSDLSDDELREVGDWSKSMTDYMRVMDGELRQSAAGESPSSIDLEDDSFAPVHVDAALVGNLLESCWAEAGCSRAGAASTLLRSLRRRLPSASTAAAPQLDSDDDDEPII